MHVSGRQRFIIIIFFLPVCQLLSPETEVVLSEHKENPPQFATLHANKRLKGWLLV